MTTRQAGRFPGLHSRWDGVAMSEAEYLALPEEKPYLEYVDGHVVQKAVPNREHSLLVHWLDFLLELYIQAHGGEAGPERRVRLERVGRRYRLPDAAYWTHDRPHGNDDVPTFAVEVRSPDESMASQRRKAREYRANGAETCWVIDPVTRTIEVFDDARDGVVADGERALEVRGMLGFSMKASELFAVLDR